MQFPYSTSSSLTFFLITLSLLEVSKGKFIHLLAYFLGFVEKLFLINYLFRRHMVVTYRGSPYGPVVFVHAHLHNTFSIESYGPFFRVVASTSFSEQYLMNFIRENNYFIPFETRIFFYTETFFFVVYVPNKCLFHFFIFHHLNHISCCTIIISIIPKFSLVQALERDA